jgi:hypothetical protein
MRLPPEPAPGTAQGTAEGTAKGSAKGSAKGLSQNSAKGSAEATAKGLAEAAAKGLPAGGVEAKRSLADQPIITNGSSGHQAPLQMSECPMMSSMDHLLGMPVALALPEAAAPASQSRPSPALPRAHNHTTPSQAEAVGKLLAVQAKAPPLVHRQVFGETKGFGAALDLTLATRHAKPPAQAAEVLPGKAEPTSPAFQAKPAKFLGDACLEAEGFRSPGAATQVTQAPFQLSPALALAHNDELLAQAKALPRTAEAAAPAPAASSQDKDIVGKALVVEAKNLAAYAICLPAPGGFGAADELQDGQGWWSCTNSTWPVSGLTGSAPAVAKVTAEAASALASQAKVIANALEVEAKGLANPCAAAQVQVPSARNEELLAQAKALPPTVEPSSQAMVAVVCDKRDVEAKVAQVDPATWPPAPGGAGSLQGQGRPSADADLQDGQGWWSCTDSTWLESGLPALTEEPPIKAEVVATTASPGAQALAPQAKLIVRALDVEHTGNPAAATQQVAQGPSQPSQALALDLADKHGPLAQAKALSPPAEAAAPAPASSMQAEVVVGEKLYVVAKDVPQASNTDTVLAPKRGRLSEKQQVAANPNTDSSMPPEVAEEAEPSAKKLKELKACEVWRPRNPENQEGAKGNEEAKEKKSEVGAGDARDVEAKNAPQASNGDTTPPPKRQRHSKETQDQVAANPNTDSSRSHEQDQVSDVEDCIQEFCAAEKAEAEEAGRKAGAAAFGLKAWGMAIIEVFRPRSPEEQDGAEGKDEAKEKKAGTGENGMHDRNEGNTQNDMIEKHEEHKEEKALKRSRKENDKVEKENNEVEEKKGNNQETKQELVRLLGDFQRNLAGQKPPSQVAKVSMEVAIIEGRALCSGRLVSARGPGGEYWVQLEKRKFAHSKYHHCIVCLKFWSTTAAQQQQLISVATYDQERVPLLVVGFETIKRFMAKHAPIDRLSFHFLLDSLRHETCEWVDRWIKRRFLR